MSERRIEREQRVTPFELFFDLVFVFGFTQVTTVLSHNPTWSGLGHALLLLTALWWAWSAYAWLTNSVDPEEAWSPGRSSSRWRRCSSQRLPSRRRSDVTGSCSASRS
jgi:hypothetical protein